VLSPVYDINTSGETDGITEHGRTYSPLRLTDTEADTIRVGLFLVLSTQIGAYHLDETLGLNHELLLDKDTTDGERSAIVAECCLKFPGVTGILDGPAVEIEDGLVAITVSLSTVAGPISLVA
jgi:hypothetical protein